MSFYIPKGTHGTFFRPYGESHTSMTLWQTKLPRIFDDEDIVFSPIMLERGKLTNSNYIFYAKQGSIGFKHGAVVFMVKMSNCSREIPENFEELLWEAEDEMDAAQARASYSPLEET